VQSCFLLLQRAAIMAWSRRPGAAAGDSGLAQPGPPGLLLEAVRFAMSCATRVHVVVTALHFWFSQVLFFTTPLFPLRSSGSDAGEETSGSPGFALQAAVGLGSNCSNAWLVLNQRCFFLGVANFQFIEI
jgi:hypothetical protein